MVAIVTKGDKKRFKNYFYHAKCKLFGCRGDKIK